VAVRKEGKERINELNKCDIKVSLTAKNRQQLEKKAAENKSKQKIVEKLGQRYLHDKSRK
jgi:hypothetical protein